MQRSSNKLGALAKALAKAQSELENPPKSARFAMRRSVVVSLIKPVSRSMTLALARERGLDRRCQRAGLDIARKCLGQHEIATVQATT